MLGDLVGFTEGSIPEEYLLNVELYQGIDGRFCHASGADDKGCCGGCYGVCCGKMASDACAAGTVSFATSFENPSQVPCSANQRCVLVSRDDFISKYRMTNLSKEEIAASTVTG